MYMGLGPYFYLPNQQKTGPLGVIPGPISHSEIKSIDCFGVARRGGKHPAFVAGHLQIQLSL
jgi:hypothetical protein